MFSLLSNELYLVMLALSWLNPSIDSAGISLKTQELYALVFVTRYLDIFDRFASVYNLIMKLIFLGSSLSIVWYMRRHKVVRRSYDKDQDTFRYQFIVLPCLLLALVINHKFTFKEVHIMFLFLLFLLNWIISHLRFTDLIYAEDVLVHRIIDVCSLVSFFCPCSLILMNRNE